MKPRITIAIDGFSSCGKSTLARDLAAALRYVHIDSGAMYRAVTLYFLQYHIDLEDPAMIADALSRIHIDFERSGDTLTTLLNGENVEAAIRDAGVTGMVSPVATISAVRRFLVAQQQRMGAGGGIVMDGRDIGTVVFPDADLKIFLTASTEVRIERRYAELIDRGYQVSREEVADSLISRDHIDTTRDDSPLRQAEDAVVIDNTLLTRNDQLDIALKLAEERIAAKAMRSRE